MVDCRGGFEFAMAGSFVGRWLLSCMSAGSIASASLDVVGECVYVDVVGHL